MFAIWAMMSITVLLFFEFKYRGLEMQFIACCVSDISKVLEIF